MLDVVESYYDFAKNPYMFRLYSHISQNSYNVDERIAKIVPYLFEFKNYNLYQIEASFCKFLIL